MSDKDKPTSARIDRCRDASPDDAAAIARVHDTSRRLAYREIVTEANLNKMTMEERTEFWRNKIVLGGQTDSRVFVIEDGGKMVGFICVQGDRHRNVGEVDRIYVLPESFGRNFGRELMNHATDHFRDFGFEKLVLWPFEANKPAHAFYLKMGLKPDGAQRKLCGVPKEIRFASPIKPW